MGRLWKISCTLHRPRHLAAIIILAILTLSLAMPNDGLAATITDSWTATGSLSQDRHLHTATLLPNGKVLVVGGDSAYNKGCLASAELYDPATGVWSVTGSLSQGRYFHTATLLPNGKVLVAGGHNDYDGLASAELYDPATGVWSATGSPSKARYGHTATLLPNGKVLVAGGYDYGMYASAELYDPATGVWSATGSLIQGRNLHTATLLPNGKVLAVGGLSGSGGILPRAELYDPVTGTWSATGFLTTARTGHTATLLPNGKVLVAGGYNNGYLASAELYDPATGAWSATGSFSQGRWHHRATLLPNGKVLVAGGYGNNGPAVASAELYDPATGAWSATGSLSQGRSHHTATLLPNGKVLVAGGIYYTFSLASAELYLQAPTANAGPNQTVPAGALVQLDGSNSTPASDIVSYQWLQTSGPAVTLSDPTIARPTFPAPQVGISGASLVFQLTVSNNSGQSSQATCTVTVTWVNQPPSANAGSDQTKSAGETVTLDGSGSIDPDGVIASYAWTQTGGPQVQLSDPASVKPAFTAPAVGEAGVVLTFQLTVTDNHGLIGTDSCIVNVTRVNQPPVAEAGADQTVKAGALVTLNGSGSTDPDDGIASYLWEQLSGTPITLSDAKSDQPTFTAPQVQYGGDVLTFQLTVTDRGGLKSSARCAVNVQWANTPPVAKVAGNLTILSKDQGLTTLQGMASDADGDPLRYRWLKGTNELCPSQAVGADGTTPLNLGAITTPLPIGQYTLTLEVTDGYAISTDTLVLTVDNSAPTVAPTGEGTFQVNSPVALGGQVSDYDGDLLSYQWLEGNAVLNGGQVQAAAGGAPASLPQFTISSLKVGTHTLTLQVSDPVNTPVAKTITVNIIDNTALTLELIPDKTILWPPNKQMVPVTIKANAVDNSGLPVTLKVALACNESQDGAVYWTQPVIDQNAGTISLQLQADRLGKGNGRQYTVTVTATDQSGNASTANVKILVPHDQGKN